MASNSAYTTPFKFIPVLTEAAPAKPAAAPVTHACIPQDTPATAAALRAGSKLSEDIQRRLQARREKAHA